MAFEETTDYGNYLLFIASGNVPNAYWNRDNHQANLNNDNTDNRNPNIGSRSSERVILFIE